MSPVDLSNLQTEGRNPRTANIDQLSTLEICQIMNREDATVPEAITSCLPAITAAIESLVDKIRRGGRIISVGAGTSGRLGVLDASELPPTFSVDPNQFVALIAGGDDALRHAQEGAEDDVEAAVRELRELKLDGQRDSLIGIAASGRTPYVLSCLQYAKSLNCNTIGIACSFPSAMSHCGHVDHMINAITGPEVVTGSTRLKAGTATKLVLNMLSTATMIRAGKTYGNIMVDLRATNLKLQQRARNILRIVSEQASHMDDSDLDHLLKACDGSVKLAIVKLKLAVSIEEARQHLETVGGILSDILVPVSSVIPSRQPTARIGSSFSLCIDGGGSKCAAVIHGRNGLSWRGGSGSCNVTSIGVENAVSAIKSALETAIARCPQLAGRRIQEIDFDRIWVALAGYDRKVVSEPANRAIEQLFAKSIGDRLSVSTDVELLATIGGMRANADSVVVLIAGTGSIAMKLVRKEGRFVRTARSGGWGPLLGDDGSGFDIGRRALRLTLADIEERSPSQADEGLKTTTPLTALSEKIIGHLIAHHNVGSIPDLLTEVISPTPGHDRAETDLKQRVASIAPLVIEASSDNPEAENILDGAISDLTRLMRPLVRNAGNEAQRPALVLAGGMVKSRVFRDRLQRSISDMPFTCTTVVEDPARTGAEYLSQVSSLPSESQGMLGK